MEAGLEITPDGHWHKLVSDGNGSVTLATGWGNEGTWNMFPSSQIDGATLYQIDMTIDGSGTLDFMTEVAQTPDAMRLYSEAGYISDYIRLK